MASSDARRWVVCKYGGTSVASLRTWSAGILARTRALLAAGHRVWIVVSALSKVTNALLSALDEATAAGAGPGAGAGAGAGASTSGAGAAVAAGPAAALPSFAWVVEAHAKLAADMGLRADEFAPAQQLLDEVRRLLDGIALTGEVSAKLRARVAAFGELLSSQLGVAFLRRSGLAAVRIDSRTLLTSYEDDAKNLSEADLFLEADVRPSVQIERADAAAQGADVVICQGFIAATPAGATCLLGRGGSDTSGALFAALCGAAKCEIWTDVNGLFTADPRFVPRARLIRCVTYREAQELAAMGAKVLHPRCLLPAAFAGVPVEVRNTMDPDDAAESTLVSADGLDYRLKDRAAAAAAAAAPAPAPIHAGSGTPRFTAMPPLRAPGVGVGPDAAGSGSRIIFSTASADGGDAEAGGDGGADSFRLDDGPAVVGAGVGADPGEGAVADARRRARSPVSAAAGGGRGGGTGACFGAGHDRGHGLGDDRSGDESPASQRSPSPALGGPAHTRPSRGLEAPAAGGRPEVLAVARRKGVTLLTMVAYDMWGNSGFLGRVFTPFGQHGVSVDLIATSQYAVSVTLDHIPDGVHGEPFRRVVASLGRLCSVEVRYPCAVVSVVGRSLRNALPQLGAAMRALQGVPVHMLSEASEDLNLSFVVDEEHADRLVADLHAELLEGPALALRGGQDFGSEWRELEVGRLLRQQRE